MIKFKLTLMNGLTLEHLSYTMCDAIKYVEDWYMSTVIKCEMIIG